MTASGTVRSRRRAGRPSSTWPSLGAVVVKSVSAEPVGRQPAAAAVPRRGGHAQQRRACRTPGWPPGWPRSSRAWPPRRHRGRPASGASRPSSTRRLPAPCGRPGTASMAGGGRRRARWSPSRPTSPAPTSRTAGRCSPTATAGVAPGRRRGSRGAGRALPLWAKLSPNVTDLPDLAAAAVEAGAAAVTLINTVMGLALDPATGRPRLGGGGGGLSGPAIHPVAVRAVYECRAALPERADRRGGRRRPAGRPPPSCWRPAPTPCRSAPPPSPIRGRPARVLRRTGGVVRQPRNFEPSRS